MRFHISARVDIPRDEFWKLRLDEEYLALYRELNHVEKVEVLKEWTTEDGINHRLQNFTPKMLDIPEVAKNIVQNAVGTVEEHFTWNDGEEPFVQYFQSHPKAFPELVTSSGWMRMDKDGEDGCIQTVDGEINVRVPLIGAMCEESAVAGLHKFYKTTFIMVSKVWIERRRQNVIPGKLLPVEFSEEDIEEDSED